MANYHSYIIGGNQNAMLLPDDAEAADTEAVHAFAEEYMSKKYPIPNPEVLHSVSGKEYYLPALKVLLRVGDNFMSPRYHAAWEDGELRAQCEGGNHKAPNPDCDCGIYASVNMGELHDWIEYKPWSPSNHFIRGLPSALTLVSAAADGSTIGLKKALCVIEPLPGAKVMVGRKGWKASAAFISEVVGETISPKDTDDLLRMAWQRDIDFLTNYQTRLWNTELRRTHENW